MRTVSLLLALCACAAQLRTVEAPLPEPASVDLTAPGPIAWEPVVSATWAVPRRGLIDLTDPRAAELSNDTVDIVLPVHVLVHPTAGAFVIDTGMPSTGDPTRGLLRAYTKDIEVHEPLSRILGRLDAPLAGVLLTHGHLDHVLGLPDVPEGVPIYAGPGEDSPVGLNGQLTFPTFRRALDGRPLTVWPFEEADGLGPVERAVDVLGDGSLWALWAPGHTPGSTAYLARTTGGPVLFTGDCSHTRWGWDHGVTPGTYTHDHEANATSLAQLKALVVSNPGMQVLVGHEI